VDLVSDLFALQRADALGSRFPEVRLGEIFKMEEKTMTILSSKVPLSISELAINGSDLMSEFSLKSGEEIGNMLKFLLNKVLDNPELNHKEKLIEIIKIEYLEILNEIK
jgi:tRNA nucleotidyltransferase (CCA-adding enzyme)